MIKDLNSIKDRVYSILEKHPITRDDDRLLFLAYMVTYHRLKAVTTSYESFREFFLNKNTPSTESIRRCRQKIQEEGFFPAAKNIGRARAEEESEVRNWSRQ